jgi:hypothetical protein
MTTEERFEKLIQHYCRELADDKQDGSAADLEVMNVLESYAGRRKLQVRSRKFVPDTYDRTDTIWFDGGTDLKCGSGRERKSLRLAVANFIEELPSGALLGVCGTWDLETTVYYRSPR